MQRTAYSPVSLDKQFTKKLSADEEKILARSMRSSEDKLIELLTEIPEAHEVMSQRGKRKEKTVSSHIDRLRAAVTGVCAMRPRPASVLQIRGLWRESEEARWKLAMSGYRIAVGEARKMGGRGLDHEDLVNEGIVGLLDAAKRFDPKRELRFSTYARWWVRARMMRAIDTTGQLVRLPGGTLERLRRVQMLKAQVERVLGEVDLTVLAERTGYAVEEISSLFQLSDEVQSLSFETPVVENGSRSRTLEDTLADESCISPERYAFIVEFKEDLEEAMLVLQPHHREVVSLYLGMSGDGGHTLQSAANTIGISRERVRQLLLNVQRDYHERRAGVPIEVEHVEEDQLLAVLGSGRRSAISLAMKMYGRRVHHAQIAAVQQALESLEQRDIVVTVPGDTETLWQKEELRPSSVASVVDVVERRVAREVGRRS